MTILVLGGQGMLGSALVRSLANQKEEVIAHNRLACDLTDSWDTYDYIKQIRPTTIYHAAGLVGGILSNMNNQYDYLIPLCLVQKKLTGLHFQKKSLLLLQLFEYEMPLGLYRKLIDCLC